VVDVTVQGRVGKLLDNLKTKLFDTGAVRQQGLLMSQAIVLDSNKYG